MDGLSNVSDPYRAAMDRVDAFGDTIAHYKFGLEFFMTGDYWRVVDELVSAGKKIFADIKVFDIPETVELAVGCVADRGVEFLTVHGNDEIVRAACERKGNLRLLAVTLLTSIGADDMAGIGHPGVEPAELVMQRVDNAIAWGCDGVVASGHEAGVIRERAGARLIIVTPGIRDAGTARNDQKRVVDVEDAFRRGSDYIVVGRPINEAMDPIAKAEEYQRRIRRIFEN